MWRAQKEKQMTERESTVRFYNKQNMKWLHIGVAIAEKHVAWCLNTPERRGWGFCTCYKVFSLRQAAAILVEVFLM
jgi:hypothetical protein